MYAMHDYIYWDGVGGLGVLELFREAYRGPSMRDWGHWNLATLLCLPNCFSIFNDAN